MQIVKSIFVLRAVRYTLILEITTRSRFTTTVVRNACARQTNTYAADQIAYAIYIYVSVLLVSVGNNLFNTLLSRHMSARASSRRRRHVRTIWHFNESGKLKRAWALFLCLLDCIRSQLELCGCRWSDAPSVNQVRAYMFMRTCAHDSCECFKCFSVWALRLYYGISFDSSTSAWTHWHGIYIHSCRRRVFLM